MKSANMVKITGISAVVLVVLTVLISVKYVNDIKETALLEQQQASVAQADIAEFNQLFIDKVLGTGGVISYEDRYEIETAIQDLNDEEITSKWEAFVNSTDGEGAQQSAVILMSLIANKLK